MATPPPVYLTKPAPHKLHKKRPEERVQSPVMEFPERLRECHDSHEVDTLPPSQQQPAQPIIVNMNQSILGLIAAASSRFDCNDRFDGESSDDDGDDATGDATDTINPTIHPQPLARLWQSTHADVRAAPSRSPLGRHRLNFVDNKLLRSIPNLPLLKSKSKSHVKSRPESESSQPPGGNSLNSQNSVKVAAGSDTAQLHPEPDAVLLPRSDGTLAGSRTASGSSIRTSWKGRVAPVMSRMLEAHAQMTARPSFESDRGQAEGSVSKPEAHLNEEDQGGMYLLANRLKQIFEFDEPEDVIEEYPCWLLQSLLLQGFMYITTRHVCFYAFLPKRAEVVKTGYLSKSGKRNPRYNRYWFRLKGDILAYYRDAANLYFPSGQIDLRYGISTEITDKDRDKVSFSVATHHRVYHFRADSAPSAKEWVKSLQRVIFRSHNDGDSVKISLPIHHIIDIEQTQMVDFAETCKIRVIDNDETYAIDEYFFTFFTSGKKAIDILRILMEDSQSKARGTDIPNNLLHRSIVGTPPKRSDVVKATLSHIGQDHSSPRNSGEHTRCKLYTQVGPGKSLDPPQSPLSQSPSRRSFGNGRRSASLNRIDRQNRNTEKSRLATGINFQSVDDSTMSMSTIVVPSTHESSASQILLGSDVFVGPTRRSLSRTRSAFPIHPLQELEKPDGQGTSTPTLHSITKMGTLPLQRAGAFAGYLNRTSRRMSSMIAADAMGYVEKVSDMWKGGRKHYDDLSEDGGAGADDDDEKTSVSNKRFRSHFALPESEKLQATYYGHMMRVLPLYGKIYISDKYLCFRSLLPGTRTKLILPFDDIENVDKEKGFRFGYHGLVVVVRAYEELFFEFASSSVRDDCAITVLNNLELTRLTRSKRLDQEAARMEREELEEITERAFPDRQDTPEVLKSTSLECPNVIYDELGKWAPSHKPPQPLNVTCLTIGSRGDVQPYIALCKGLMAEGHRTRIATHSEFRDWIEGHGIEFAPVEGDPSRLMQLCIENGAFTWAFLREANSSFRGWLEGLLSSAWVACQGTDVLIESPSAMAGIHIAEALGILYFRAFTMPWTRTRAYPHAFVMPANKMGGAYNYMTYVMFDNVFWKATASQINRWRSNTLKLPHTTLEKMKPNQVPFLYCFSPAVVPPPLDYSDWIRVTGYWFLDEGSTWEPPRELVDFIARARADGKKLVYVGFGSIIVKDPERMTQEVIDAVRKADVRCILSKGWSDRLSNDKGAVTGAPQSEGTNTIASAEDLPAEIHLIKSAPHDWLFGQIDAAAHHGGSGTTGASLRAGIPTIIRPFFGDQYFWASRVEDLGVGIYLKKWGTWSFARALWRATNDERMIVKARLLGDAIKKENGVQTAIQSIYRDMEYAKSLIKRKAGHHSTAAAERGGTGELGLAISASHDKDDDGHEEEAWTFIGTDQPDPDSTTPRLSDGLVVRAAGGLRGAAL